MGFVIPFDEENLWIGTWGGGLAHFKGTEWTIYNTQNSPIGDDEIRGLAIDIDGNIWAGGVNNGVFRFDGNEWTHFHTGNSPLSHNSITDIKIDALGNKWIATQNGGLSVYNEGGIIVKEEPVRVPEITTVDTELFQNYPNPFHGQTTIGFSLTSAWHVTIEIYDVYGRLIELLAMEFYPAGTHFINWDASGNAGGIYFYRLRSGNEQITKSMLLIP